MAFENHGSAADWGVPAVNPRPVTRMMLRKTRHNPSTGRSNSLKTEPDMEEQKPLSHFYPVLERPSDNSHESETSHIPGISERDERCVPINTTQAPAPRFQCTDSSKPVKYLLKRSTRNPLLSVKRQWVLPLISLAIFSVIGTWLRQEKIEVGFCGVGKPQWSSVESDVPHWVRTAVGPRCETCPQHATCYPDMVVRCADDFTSKSHWTSLGGLIPVPPTCEAASGRPLQSSMITRQTVEALRERRRQWACRGGSEVHGDVDFVGPSELEMKSEIAQQNANLAEAEFDTLWSGALQEAVAQGEIVRSGRGSSSTLALAPTSTTHLRLACALRRLLHSWFTEYADEDVARRSLLIQNMLEDLGEISQTVLKKVFEWCEHHRNDPGNSDKNGNGSSRETASIDQWDQEFMQVDQDIIFEIILAANYLDIKDLLDLGCKTVANMIKGKSPEEIRRMFHIPNDFTPEEEEQIRRENEWAEEYVVLLLANILGFTLFFSME
ncbi:hypothetical protein ETB97_003987 [Aspergillus alliaceus]|uniref:E3 ubiquitin ligase complex SCF subunit sconC n=1 Tax=Petromyces alliaceus TaxID=209559 RepID=A0A8H6A0A3_PETAA|nr:hypothetical protein ETB97_003987 [Aspergillus burnettii]